MYIFRCIFFDGEDKYIVSSVCAREKRMVVTASQMDEIKRRHEKVTVSVLIEVSVVFLDKLNS